MLQNKIYQNFIIEIFRTFFLILFGLSLIALTVRAVSFLELIVDNGYPVSTYFYFSVLNLFGIIPKFIPLAFLITLTLFILKHIQDSEFLILWTSGEKKIFIVNLFIYASVVVSIFYLILSTFLTPITLNQSRQLLSNEKFNSLLPTVRAQQFSDSFKGFTFFVEKKIDNEIKNIFINDKGSNLRNFSSNSGKVSSTTILAENGIIDNKNLFLLNGQIITYKKNEEHENIRFDQLNIDLKNLTTSTIKKPKIQETSTLKLIGCLNKNSTNKKICNEGFKKEIIPTLNRRITISFYIPIISIICGFLLIKSKKIYFNKILVFFYSFSLLLFIELTVRYTGINNLTMLIFLILPFILILFLYLLLQFQFKGETKTI